ncbi:MAG: hypothetical protein K2O69_05205 [Odoribacter sp.]|nr:hypothetical protein [Odoribacter sp.]
MKSSLYIVFWTLLVFSITGCYDDKGNYDYRELHLTEIKGIEDEYARISFKDTLFIYPEITPVDASYEYIWTINKSYDNMPTGGSISKDTIGIGKNLAYPVAVPNGLYDINLKVTNTETGHAVYYNTSLLSKTEFSLGFYVLKETDGNTELDLHMPDGGVATNLIEKSVGESMQGAPTSLGLLFDYCFIDPATNAYVDPAPSVLTVCAGSDTKLFNTQDMSVVFSYEDMFFGEAPQGEAPLYLYPNGFCIVYLSDKGVYSNYQCASWGLCSAGKFGLPGIIDKDCSPDINMIFNDMNTYLFDKLNHRFLQFDFNGGFHIFSDKGEDGQAMLHSPNAVPVDYELIFFGRNQIGDDSKGYALFEDIRDRTKHYLYTLVLDADYNPIEKVETIGESSKFNRASLYAINEEDARLIYFVCDNLLYRYEIEAQRETLVTLDGFEGGEITYISNRYWKSKGDTENNFNHLAVGTYQSGEYCVYLYNMLGGIPQGKPVRVLRGEGKAVKMQFLSPKMSANSEDASYYPVSF